ncbi:MAG TPA: phospholipase D-like domain-containing protein [Xanthobacteraceae bacterium]|jgi:phosphatidylserine/phosphatidylglycerophosphate/cardiolipin synthase-like enzyme|nr:phospholipase D-like domain-containing protein [Xanthobacteraceae bacterium]
MAGVTIKPYASPTCVLLAFDWADGAHHPDFLGFAIRRDPGYGADKKPQFLFNKLDFNPLPPNAKPKPSDQAPIQKFNWWDSGFKTADRGKKFNYEVIPVCGTGPDDLKLQEDAAGHAAVMLPEILDGKIATYFNRAVVSSQSFPRTKALKDQMEWLANGLQDAVPEVLHESDAFDCAIYHLSDGLWILPSLKEFSGRGSLTYFDKGKDTKSEAGAKYLSSEPNISKHRRDAIAKLMHDKFIVSYKDGREAAVLMGSTNFTPEAQTVQANLLHILHSPQLADLYAQRAQLLAKNKKTSDIAKFAGWHDVTDVPDTKLRVFFTPETGKQRRFLDTVTDAVKTAKSSVLFCMFTASDTNLMSAIFAQGDSPDHLIYGLINAIDDPDRPTKKGKKRTNLPKIAATIYHRSTSKKPDTLAYAAFNQAAPRGFLPELRSIDTSPYDVSVAKKTGNKKSIKGGKGPPPIHVHHKFIVIDGDTANPTIYSGSPNFSAASENGNDENVLEIKGNSRVADIYVAEFMRLYNHYRARALWDQSHGGDKSKTQPTTHDSLVLKRSRDEWAKADYTTGTKAFLARTRGL